MFNLNSNDINNNKQLSFLQDPNNIKYKQYIIENINLERISLYIFNHYEEIDNRIYLNLVYALTCGDELKTPLDFKTAQVLFFSLLVNINKEIKIKISNYQQAYFIFNSYEGDYSAIVPEEDNRTPYWAGINVQFPGIVDNFKIEFLIPISEFTNKKLNIKQYTLSGVDHCKMKIFGEEYFIPRKIYIEFFKQSMYQNRLIKNDLFSILMNFDKNNNETALDCLYYVGFVSNPNYKEIEINQHYFCEDNKILSYSRQESNEDKGIIWESKDNYLYILMPNIDYIPIKSRSENQIILLTK